MQEKLIAPSAQLWPHCPIYNMSVSLSDLDAARPPGGLFAGKNWLSSPEPFPLDRATFSALEGLGHRLQLFLKVANDIYYRSAKGKLPPWIAETLDAGKPPELIDAARHPALRASLPGIIRPDLLLTEDGFALTEIDSVPGGIGLTAWLAQTYSALDPSWTLAGGAQGMQQGFTSLFPQGADIAVSTESGDYRPEMEWFASTSPGDHRVVSAESHTPAAGRDIYRFFELFDTPQIQHWRAMQDAAAAGSIHLSAPIKPWLEEKAWLAMFWSRPLRELWRQELRENHRDALAKLIPFGWLMDPTPLPHHAVLPRLEIQSWDELQRFSQKQRRLVLKLSGFSELAWGSRSVTIGHDASQEEWSARVTQALAEHATQPWILQEFQTAKIIQHPYFDSTGQTQIMQGRVRLCPYYFAPRDGSRLQLGGILATIVPADKKIIHGMKDGILVPCRVLDS